MPNNKAEGIIEKFFPPVRLDGTSAAGEKHDGCDYWILDLSHDRFALPALANYRYWVKLNGYDALAADLDVKIKEMQARGFTMLLRERGYNG
jgi:hypothetical protein